MLSQIKADFEKLIALYEAQRERADALENELSEARASIETYVKQIDDLRSQVSTLELKGAFITGGDSSSASKQKLDRLIREIDKCISLLEKD